MNQSQIPNVTIIGGGITGLSCAYYLHTFSRERNIPLQISLLEATNRIGGVIETIKVDGSIVELGPDAIFTEKKHGINLCKALGIENEIIGTNPALRKSFIYSRGRLLPVPEGFYLMAPARLLPFCSSPILSWKGKARMLLEPFIPRKKTFEDESLASFVGRRLGKEVLERIAQPMVGGIYSSDPKKLSLLSTFPKFLNWESQYGSVLIGLMKEMRSGTNTAKNEAGPRYSLFISLKNGLQSMVDALEKKLPAGAIKLNRRAETITPTSIGQGPFKIKGKNFEMEADAIVFALPAMQTAALIQTIHKNAAEELKKIRAHSGVTVNFIFKNGCIEKKLDGFGFVVPEVEGKLISGCTYASVKFAGRTAENQTLLRAFAGGKKYETLQTLNDHELKTLLYKELKEILKITEKPVQAVVRRHKNALAQYEVGHRSLVAAIENNLSGIKGIALAGNAYEGVGIPDCVYSGQKAAEKILKDLAACSD